jgi:hypothetical protein
MERFELSDKRYVDHYRQYGFAHVVRVFSRGEVEDLRRRCRELFDSHHHETGDLLTYPALRHVALDERLLEMARAVLGSRLVYFGESSFVVDHRRKRLIHRDARNDPEDPSRTAYPIMRFGIYLQDHARFSDGLKVRPGSHRRLFWTSRNAARLVAPIRNDERISPTALLPTPYYNIPSEPGDVVFWNLRTHHCGHAVRLRRLPRLALPPAVENFIPRQLQISLERERYAIFMSLGAPSPALDRYITERVQSPYNQGFWQRCGFNDPEVVALCREKGVEVRTDGLAGARPSAVSQPSAANL